MTLDVVAELQTEPTAGITNLGAEAHHDTITLAGRVSSAIAKLDEGVQAVCMNLEWVYNFNGGVSDPRAAA
jgi:hypothetical protein